MPDSKREGSDEEAGTPWSGQAREPDLSLPDLDVESAAPADTDRSEPPPPRDHPRPPAFGGKQWFLLWLVITLGVAAGHLLAGLVMAPGATGQLGSVVSAVTGGSGEGAADAEARSGQEGESQ